MTVSSATSSHQRSSPEDPGATGVTPDVRWDAKLVSVIVLNLNGEKILRNCLDHLLRQTYRNLEIIVIDNGSTDGSVAVLEQYLGTGKLSVVRCHKNLGVPGGRNLGVWHAQGEILAFMDNDGSPDPAWLEHGVAMLESDQRIGGVAALVFFAGKKILLNGAGGTINFQGYGADFHFNAPYEFAELPHEVLYSAAIGMIIRKTAMQLCGPLDTALIKWYEDTELGIRLWKLGFRVVVCPRAWADHDIGHSDQFLPDRIYLCEKGRIRTMLKYCPLSRVPQWLLREIPNVTRYGRRRWIIPAKAWLWNLAHLGSALRWRLRFFGARAPFWHLVHPSWGTFPPPIPNNRSFQPVLRRAGAELVLDGTTDVAQLNFGWYDAESDGALAYRWTDVCASAFFSLSAAVGSLAVTLRSAIDVQSVTVMIRRAGEIAPKVQISLTVLSTWKTVTCAVVLRPGVYELLLIAERSGLDRAGRLVGPAVASVVFR
jgi:GT2 family glycosyltransferase